MKKLEPCKTCGKEVSITAKTCPHCGQSHPTFPIATVSVIMFAVVGFGIYYFWDDLAVAYKVAVALKDLFEKLHDVIVRALLQ